MIVLAVDPGPRNTGIVVRDHDRLLEHTLAVRPDELDVPEFALDLATDVELLLRRHSVELCAVEGFNRPGFVNGQRRKTDPHQGYQTGLITGAVLAAFDNAPVDYLIIAPGGHGRSPLTTYPNNLVGPRERTGSGQLQHCRSAWDIAGIAHHQHAIEELRQR